MSRAERQRKRRWFVARVAEALDTPPSRQLGADRFRIGNSTGMVFSTTAWRRALIRAEWNSGFYIKVLPNKRAQLQFTGHETDSTHPSIKDALLYARLITSTEAGD